MGCAPPWCGRPGLLPLSLLSPPTSRTHTESLRPHVQPGPCLSSEQLPGPDRGPPSSAKTSGPPDTLSPLDPLPHHRPLIPSPSGSSRPLGTAVQPLPLRPCSSHVASRCGHAPVTWTSRVSPAQQRDSTGRQSPVLPPAGSFSVRDGGKGERGLGLPTPAQSPSSRLLSQARLGTPPTLRVPAPPSPTLPGPLFCPPHPQNGSRLCPLRRPFLPVHLQGALAPPLAGSGSVPGLPEPAPQLVRTRCLPPGTVTRLKGDGV